jgi:predicted AlkP superfamily pyrophosphatase or phosphodiesterase
MRRLAAILFLGLAWAPAAAQTPTPAPLIVISIDAFRADYIRRGVTPTLSALAREGAQAAAVHPSFPSQTFPNHYTLVTGLRPDHHGLVSNTMEDAKVSPEIFSKTANSFADPRWWNGGTPLWVTAGRAGKRTASFAWPGSDVTIHGGRPTYVAPWRKGGSAADAAALVLNWMDLGPARRPAITFVYLDAVDEAGHDHGPNSPEVTAALRGVDAAIATLVAGLKRRGLYQRTNLIVLSDHGLADMKKGQMVVLDELVDTSKFRLLYYGPSAGIAPLPGHEAEVEKALSGRHAHATCWRKAEIPAQLHFGTHARVPGVICAADDGWRIVTRQAVANWAAEKPGDHGYPADATSMDALFLARGPAFRKGATLPAFDNVDVYSLLAHLSGLTPEKNDGTLATFRSALK